MSKFFIPAVPGANYKTIFENGATGQIWNTITPGFEPWNPANVLQYQVASTVDEKGEVSGTIPVGIPDCDELTAKAVIIAGADLATSDFPPVAGYSGVFRNGDWVRNIASLVQSGSETGNGDIPVDHNYGGTNALQVVDDALLPVDNATIRAYVDSEFQIGNIDPQPPSTFTNSQGKWVEPLMLDNGGDAVNGEDWRLLIYNPITKKTKAVVINVK